MAGPFRYQPDLSTFLVWIGSALTQTTVTLELRSAAFIRRLAQTSGATTRLSDVSRSVILFFDLGIRRSTKVRIVELMTAGPFVWPHRLMCSAVCFCSGHIQQKNRHPMKRRGLDACRPLISFFFWWGNPNDNHIPRHLGEAFIYYDWLGCWKLVKSEMLVLHSATMDGGEKHI